MTNKKLQPAKKAINCCQISAFRNLKPITHNLKPKKGFAMLFSVLISSLLVVIGLSIFNLTLKEITLSTAARESQMAFYAAHAGLECALYWDFHGDALWGTAFATSTDSWEINRVASIGTNCNGVDVNANPTSVSPTTVITTASFNITPGSNGPCVTITVSKAQNSSDPSKDVTIIESHGNNICGAGRKVERGLRADYAEQ